MNKINEKHGNSSILNDFHVVCWQSWLLNSSMAEFHTLQTKLFWFWKYCSTSLCWHASKKMCCNNKYIWNLMRISFLWKCFFKMYLYWIYFGIFLRQLEFLNLPCLSSSVTWLTSAVDHVTAGPPGGLSLDEHLTCVTIWQHQTTC